MPAFGMNKNILSKTLSTVGLGPKFTCNKWLNNKIAAGLLGYFNNSNWQSLDKALDHYRKKEPLLYHLCLSALGDHSGEPVLAGCWLRANPESAHAHIVLAQQLIEWAWEARGGGTADTVKEKDFEHFFARLLMAEELLAKAVELDNTNPEPFALLLVSGNGLQVERDELDARFTELVRRSPSHHSGHSNMLYAITEKWGGSHEDMFKFARENANNSPQGSPLNSLIAQAHIEYWSYIKMFEDDYYGALNYICSKKVQTELKAAYKRSILHPNYRASILEPDYCGLFTMAFYLGRRHKLAKDAMQRLNGTSSPYPWYYMSDGIREYLDTAYVLTRVQKNLQR